MSIQQMLEDTADARQWVLPPMPKEARLLLLDKLHAQLVKDCGRIQ